MGTDVSIQLLYEKYMERVHARQHIDDTRALSVTYIEKAITTEEAKKCGADELIGMYYVRFFTGSTVLAVLRTPQKSFKTSGIVRNPITHIKSSIKHENC